MYLYIIILNITFLQKNIAGTFNGFWCWAVAIAWIYLACELPSDVSQQSLTTHSWLGHMLQASHAIPVYIHIYACHCFIDKPDREYM